MRGLRCRCALYQFRSQSHIGPERSEAPLRAAADPRTGLLPGLAQQGRAVQAGQRIADHFLCPADYPYRTQHSGGQYVSCDDSSEWRMIGKQVAMKL